MEMWIDLEGGVAVDREPKRDVEEREENKEEEMMEPWMRMSVPLMSWSLISHVCLLGLLLNHAMATMVCFMPVVTGDCRCRSRISPNFDASRLLLSFFILSARSLFFAAFFVALLLDYIVYYSAILLNIYDVSIMSLSTFSVFYSNLYTFRLHIPREISAR